MLFAVAELLVGAEMRMQTWRWTELLQMLEVTTTGTLFINAKLLASFQRVRQNSTINRIVYQ